MLLINSPLLRIARAKLAISLLLTDDEPAGPKLVIISKFCNTYCPFFQPYELAICGANACGKGSTNVALFISSTSKIFC